MNVNIGAMDIPKKQPMYFIQPQIVMDCYLIAVQREPSKNCIIIFEEEENLVWTGTQTHISSYRCWLAYLLYH